MQIGEFGSSIRPAGLGPAAGMVCPRLSGARGWSDGRGRDGVGRA
jgi:hypothetical protein